jgi:phosphatidylglycerol lysyltransferase
MAIRVRPWQIAALVVIGVLALLFVSANREEIPAAVDALRGADPAGVAIAALLCLVLLSSTVACYHAAYRAMGLRIPIRRLVRPALGAQFINMTLRAGGLGGLVLFLRDAAQDGLPRGRVVSAYLLAGLLGQVAVGLILAVALVVIWLRGELGAAQLAAAGIFAAYLAIYGGAILAAARSRTALRALHELPERLRRGRAEESGQETGHAPAAHAAADELYEALGVLLRRPGAALRPGVYALLIELSGVMLIWVALRSLGEPVGLGMPIVGYSLSVIVSLLGIAPAGIGLVEASLGTFLIASDIPGPTAAVAVLIYRVFDVWIPFAVGLWAAQAVLRRPRP